LAHRKSNLRTLKQAAVFCAAAGIILAGLALSACKDDSSGTTEPPADPNAQILITYPKGGETFYVDDSLHIKWSLQGAGLTDVNSVNIELSMDSGMTFATILGKSIATGELNFGNYGWKIPATILKNGVAQPLAGHKDLFFRIKEYNPSSPNQVTVMKKPFSISTR
jgi:hypothetical protein